MNKPLARRIKLPGRDGHTCGTRRVSSLAVTRAAENSLPSGIRYGRLPQGEFVATEPSPLIHGRLYHVVVFRWIGAPGGPGSLVARESAVFVF